jgi:hypothetical protein
MHVTQMTREKEREGVREAMRGKRGEEGAERRER